MSTVNQNGEHANNCIGNLEHHVHKVFALVRVPGEDFVYSASIDLFNRLNEYCDEQTITESRPPFLIKGESGTGKSALLSNWLQRRERNSLRSRTDEFVFWHAVGCSRQSMNVNILIRRLIVELKTRFELSRSLPKSQERYSWELPRFLELASKRGKVIIVIDGLNRLVNNENSEDSLAWLPLEFPPNVRVVLSVTIPTAAATLQSSTVPRCTNFYASAPGSPGNGMMRKSVSPEKSKTENRESDAKNQKSPSSLSLEENDYPTSSASTNLQRNVNYQSHHLSHLHSNNGANVSVTKKSRILMELDRRCIPFMLMKPLDKELCRSLVETFIHKSVNSESASLATGPYIATFLNPSNNMLLPAVRNRQQLQQHRNSDSSSEASLAAAAAVVEQSTLRETSTGRASTIFGLTSIDSVGGRSSSENTEKTNNYKSSKVNGGGEVLGFLLFENQITSLLNHSQGGTPLFLRLFLRCLQYAVSRGYSLWHVYNDWMMADSVPDLLIRILSTLEGNFVRSRAGTQFACDMTISAGGLPALKLLYSWHPSFQHQQQQQYPKPGVGSTTADDSEGGSPTYYHHHSNDNNISHSAAHNSNRTDSVTGKNGKYKNKPSNSSISAVIATEVEPSAAAPSPIASGRGNNHYGHSSGQHKGQHRSDKSVNEATATVRHTIFSNNGTKTNNKLQQKNNNINSTGQGSSKRLSSEVLQNLGDQAWITAERSADMKLHQAMQDTRDSIDAALSAAKEVVSVSHQQDTNSSNSSNNKTSNIPIYHGDNLLLHSIVANIRRAYQVALTNAATFVLKGGSEGSVEPTDLNPDAAATTIMPGSIFYTAAAHPPQSNLRLRAMSMDSDAASITVDGDNNSFDERENGSSSIQETCSDTDDDDAAGNEDDSLVSLEDRSVASDHTIHSKTIRLTQELIPESMRSPLMNNDHTSSSPHSGGKHKKKVATQVTTGSDKGGSVTAAIMPIPRTDIVRGQNLLQHSLDSTSHNDNIFTNVSVDNNYNDVKGIVAEDVVSSQATSLNHNTAASFDASEGLHTLPIYLRGGVDTTGFGEILGNALALLYVSRQGLRETELWHMLSLLQYKSEKETHLSKEMRTLNHMAVRRTACQLLDAKASLSDMFKADDITRTGYITRKQMLTSMKKLYPSASKADLVKLLEFLTIHSPSLAVNANVNLMHYYQNRELVMGNKIHYDKLFMVLKKLNKEFKFNEVSNGKDGGLLLTLKQQQQQGLISKSNVGGGNSAGSRTAAKSAAAASRAATTGVNGSNKTATSSNEPVNVGDDDYDNFQLAVPVNVKGSTNDEPIEGDDDVNDDENFSLGPIIEESLLCILSALGVLHDPENKVLILPSDSEPFRQVIYNNYILKRGGGTELYWHQQIIYHFQTEPNSLRKCEELPWHMKICHKWHALRDTLVDLQAFDLMAQNDLKDELMGYWLLLTEGPLIVPDHHSSSGGHNAAVGSSGSEGGKGVGMGMNKYVMSMMAVKNSKEDDEDDTESTHSHLLREIDFAKEHRMSVKEFRRKILKNQIQPFDIVEELNKSLETWVTAERPSPNSIHRTIIQIAKFLYDFSRRIHPTPDFIRLGIDMNALSLFCGSLPPAMRGLNAGNNSTTGAVSARARNTTDGIIDESNNTGVTGNDFNNSSPTKLNNSNNSNNSPGSLAIRPKTPQSFTGGNTATDGTGGQQQSSSTVKYYDKIHREEIVKFPPPHMVNSNLYLYLRWIWIQFPWLGLHPAAAVAVMLRAHKQEEEGKYSGNLAGASFSEEAEKLRKAATTKPSTAAASMTGDKITDSLNIPIDNNNSGALKFKRASATNNDNERLLRVWNVKKSDPTIPVYHSSINRKLAAIKPRTSLSSSLERNADVSFDRLYAECTSPSHIARIRLGGFKNRDKFRRSFEDEVEQSKAIPFAYHGVRTMKNKSLFPTYEKSIAEDNRKKDEITVNGGGSKTGSISSGLNYSGGGGGSNNSLDGGGGSSSNSMKPKALKKFNVDEALQQQRRAVSSVTPDAPFMLLELDDEIRRMNNDEYINKHKIERTGAAIIIDETGLEYEASLDRIARAKTIRNKLFIIRAEKIRLIRNLQNEINLRNESDQQLIDEVVNSEGLLRSLHERNIAIEESMEEAKDIEEGYEELLKALKNNPPYIESHVKSLEIEVELAEKQFQEMEDHRNKLYHEDERRDNFRREQLTERIAYFQHARSEVAAKKKQISREIKHLINGNTGSNGNSSGEGISRRTSSSRYNNSNRANMSSLDGVNLDNDGGGSMTSSYDSDSSEDSSISRPDLALTKPVIHFLNAIVRKVTYNEALIKETDKTLEDVKKRYIEETNEDDELLANTAANTGLGGEFDSTMRHMGAIRRRINKMGTPNNNDLISKLSAAAAAAALENELNAIAGGNLDSTTNFMKSSSGVGVGDWQQGGNNGGNGSSSNTVATNNSDATAPGASKTRLPFGAGMTSAAFISKTGLAKSLISTSSPTSKSGSGATRHITIAGSSSATASTGNGNSVNVANGNSSITLQSAGTGRYKTTNEQNMQLKDSLKHFCPIHTGNNLDETRSRELFKAQVQRAVMLLLEKTQSVSAEEFLDRFLQGTALLQSLRKQQISVDSRLALLQAEHSELQAACSDLTFIAQDGKNGNSGNKDNSFSAFKGSHITSVQSTKVDDANNNSNNSSNTSPNKLGGGRNSVVLSQQQQPTASAVENGNNESNATTINGAELTGAEEMAPDDRYLDNQLFAKEVRMNHWLHLKDKSEYMVSEVRTAIGYLINLMVINGKLLHALPKSEPPVLQSDDDIMLGVSWFEDRIMALSEALTMDVNRPAGPNASDEVKTLPERQLELALLVQGMQKENASKHHRGHHKSQRKQHGGISKGLIQTDGDAAPFVSPLAGIMVTPVGKVDKIFDSKMSKLIAERERHSDDLEQGSNKYSKDSDNNFSKVQDFLQEGLDFKLTRDLSRKANMLQNKRTGRAISYGLVLEKLLVSKGQNLQPPPTIVKKVVVTDVLQLDKKNEEKKTAARKSATTAIDATNRGNHSARGGTVDGLTISTNHHHHHHSKKALSPSNDDGQYSGSNSPL